MNTKNRGLGRGLSAIFEVESAAIPNVKATKTSMEEVDITLIDPNPKQPRSTFSEDALEELADSIKVLGVIQPITVNAEENGRYTIISGERRWRASQMAGMNAIPVYVRKVDSQAHHEMALVENIQRQDLNPIDVAMSLQRLVDECSLTQDTLAERVGKKRSTIANYMRLLKLPLEVQLALREEYITMGHAKAIASAPEEKQIRILKKTIKRALSVRQTEELVKKSGLLKTKASDEEYPESYTKLVEELERFFNQNISIKKSKSGGGKIVIDFADENDIDAFLRKFHHIK